MHSALMVCKHPVPSLVEGLQYIYHAWQCQLELLLKAIETSRDTGVHLLNSKPEAKGTFWSILIRWD